MTYSVCIPWPKIHCSAHSWALAARSSSQVYTRHRLALLMREINYKVALNIWPQWIKQEAQLSQSHRATRYVSWNLVSCLTAVWKIAFEKEYSRRITSKVIKINRICRPSTILDTLPLLHCIWLLVILRRRWNYKTRALSDSRLSMS